MVLKWASRAENHCARLQDLKLLSPSRFFKKTQFRLHFKYFMFLK